MRKIFSITLLTLCFIALTGKADGEVKLKQKAYEPRKKLEASQLRTRTYKPEDSRDLKTKPIKTRREGWWNVFRSKKPESVSDPLRGAASVESTPLRQNKRISAATMKAVPQSVTEKKPHETGVSKSAKPYTPDNKPRPKNPLLRPRQNIKEPQ
ncbi:MAG: hypothetical protein PHG71_08790 [Kiritimatiellae bacterium]|nr:hypothetical protein [Kiritimatiellia bacterium]